MDETVVVPGPGFAPCPHHLNAHPNTIPEFEDQWLAAQACPDCIAWGTIDPAWKVTP